MPSPLCSVGQMHTESDHRRSRNSFDCSRLENTTMVPAPTAADDRRPSTSAKTARSTSVAAQPRTSSTSTQASTCRVEIIRQALSSEGVPSNVSDTILSSWRQNTNKQFESAWRCWCSWCSKRKTDPVQATVADLLTFLQELMEKGLQYRTLNVYRSAISSAHHFVDGKPIGQHHLVSRFFKGVFNLRPPKPRYNTTWDVSVVLRYLNTLPDNRRLSVKQLSLKLAMLIALVTAGRCSSLIALDISSFRKERDGDYVFCLEQLSKCASIQNPYREVTLHKYSGNRKLCVVRTLEEYIERTTSRRGSGNEKITQLFISYGKPYHPVVSSTIARWLKCIMAEAGIDTSCFKAHSTRGASASAAKRAGATMSDILKTADWSSSRTFAAFYCRNTDSLDYD